MAPQNATASPIASEASVHAAISMVDDPEYPGISIVDLGLLESISIEEHPVDGTVLAAVTVGLIPTFSGCPALAIIADEVTAAVERVAGVDSCVVQWLSEPAWHTDRISHEARACLARKYTVSVQLGTRPTTCALCGSKTVEQSMFGASRCRSIHTCTGCGETVEVVRG